MHSVMPSVCTGVEAGPKLACKPSRPVHGRETHSIYDRERGRGGEVHPEKPVLGTRPARYFISLLDQELIALFLI